MAGLGSQVYSRIARAAVVVVGVLAIVQSGSAVPGTMATYAFVGTCQDCTGSGIASLTVQNYTLGTTLTNSNLVSFSYRSNLLTFTVTAGNGSLSGSLPAVLPGPANVSVSNFLPFLAGSEGFISQTNGVWCAGPTCLSDLGTGGVWSLPAAAPTATPAPNTLMLLGVALVLVLMAQMLLKLRRLPKRTAAR